MGEAPPLIGVAVKVTFTPAQAVLPGDALTETDGVMVAFVNVTPLLMLCALTKQGVALDVITTLTESLAKGAFNK